MVNARGGLLPGMALHRVLDKPFCITEYGHPALALENGARPKAIQKILAGQTNWKRH